MTDVEIRGERIAQFIKDEAIQEALANMREANYGLFRIATTEEERRMAQARAVVLETFEQSMRVIIGAGERERLERERAERRPTTR